MIWILFVQALLSFTSGVTSQPTLTQPPSESVSLGQTVNIPCTTSWYPKNISWLQQRPGQGPRFVHCDGCNRGPGIPDRFTGTRSGNTGYLTITDVKDDDVAAYYCQMWNSNSRTFLFGSGTHLTVLGEPTASPKVPPPKEEINSTQ